MGTGKYPEEIVEKVAKAIRGATDDGADRTEDYAIAVLDALGLTVTEEWASETVDSIDSATSKSRAQEWASEDGGVLVRRFAFEAHETPWEVMDQ